MSLIIVIVGSLLLGCSRQTGDKDVIPLRSSVIFAIEQDGEVKLSMWTTEVFPCLNYDLRTDFRQTGRRIEVKIDGVVPPKTCFGREGPARYVHSMVSLSPGTYELVIASQRQTDRYRIRAVQDRLEIDPVQQSFTDYWD
ncbi:MAG: hypothetical protein ACE5F6_16565 [Anaerolineae bacterium]